MRIGIAILQDRPWRENAPRWRQAEAWGFAHGWVYDHIGWRTLVDRPWFDAVPTLAAAATVTSTMRLGTFVASPNFRHPVPFGREVTALDDISAGRLLLGVGAGTGGTSFDNTVLGAAELTPKTRFERYAEFAELLDLLLREDHVTWRGEHYAAVDARNLPGCVQRPRVPMIMAANGPRGLRLVAKHAQGWVTTGGEPGAALTPPSGAELRAQQNAWWKTVEELSKRLDDTLDRAGRERGTLDRYLSLDSAPVFSLSSVDAFAEAHGRAAELGFTDIITHWPRADGWYAGDEAVLEKVAAEFLTAAP
ncbi:MULTISPECIES: LLM class flavin-dependent oxidoreductase [Catenuloplanes]|uniref:Alkanesulfonate monooxygenase SsuD/methylene tetrahydromethanopterin reductase-like flavin-dependent oxidoreductase (Luciferase family) n=1 Tax=Catenuloplanes niger TaxID=587534 RepID=A0AAE3ZSW3_9ACTN|nr:LLM class flavin-dependent oxidoreductase [Catenuloplanes niger]MDR7324392.1 alkanesulfonate monooxygenase SsuD/methylene tetrahydromethanopterin reductase-like flavin-dependent oxidoreductase (luciferase family) [Catenuloplanes niger]